MADPQVPPSTPAPAPTPARIPIVTTDGQLGTIPAESLHEALRQGAHVPDPAELQQRQFGTPADQAKALGLGALETATGGASTALAGEYGVLTGGQQKRREIEQGISGVEKENPISHIAGEALPLLAMPEAAGEVAPGSFAGRTGVRFLEGATQEAQLRGSQGVSEDLLNHDLSAQSYFSHAASPEVLFAGALNMGLGAGFEGIGKLLPREVDVAKTVGFDAATDADRAQSLIQKAQKAGFTSDEASRMYAGAQDIAQRAAADPEREGFFRGVFDHYAKTMSRGAPEVESALKREFASTVDRFQGADRVLDTTTKEAMGHTNEVLRGIGRMNELQFGLKESTVQKLIEPTNLSRQIDSALTLRRELGKSLDAAAPMVDMAPGGLKKIWETVKKLDAQIAEATAATGAGVSEMAARRAGAKLYTAIDDSKRVVGRYAKFGHEAKDGFAQLADSLYHDQFRPMLEDGSLWGDRLAAMQTETNASYAQGITAARRFQSLLGQVLETPMGKPVYTAEFGKMRGVLAELEHASSPEDIAGLRAEVVQRVIDNTRARVHSMVNTMDLAPADVAELRKTVKAANDLEAVVKRAQQEQGEFRTLREMKQRETEAGTSGIVRNVTGIATNPAKTTEMIARLSNLETRVKQVIRGDAQKLVRREPIMSTTKPITPIQRKQAMRAMRDVQEMAANPKLAQARVADFVKPLEAHPKTQAALATMAVRLIGFLATQVPPPRPSKFLDDEPRWTDADAEKFWKSLELGLYPLTAFERAQKNQFRPQDQKLLSYVAPDLYSEIQAQLLDEYRQAEAKGYLKKLPYQEKQMLSRLMGTPLEGTMSPDFAASMQKVAMSDPNAQGAIGASAQGGRPRKADLDTDSYKTPSERIGSSPP